VKDKKYKEAKEGYVTAKAAFEKAAGRRGQRARRPLPTRRLTAIAGSGRGLEGRRSLRQNERKRR